jgi:hypothetical protein
MKNILWDNPSATTSNNMERPPNGTNTYKKMSIKLCKHFFDMRKSHKLLKLDLSASILKFKQ